MKKLALIVTVSVLCVFAGFSPGGATPCPGMGICLEDWAINIDGTLTTPSDPLPGVVSASGDDFATGLGLLRVGVTNPGLHFVGVFVDHAIDEDVNTFFNEFGSSTGMPGTGESWEIDEPGFRPQNPGDIFTHFMASDPTASQLDNTNTLPATSPDDVSMALGRSFALATGESALVSFLVSQTQPQAGFFLTQTDPDSA